VAHALIFDRDALAPVVASAIWEDKQMKKLTTTVISTVCLVAGAGSATLYAQATAPVYTVYEANITDEAAYSKALPEVEKYIKENDGTRVAGGFNKAKLISGKEKLGNRYVIVRWASAAAFDKAMDAGLKAWIDKYGNGARQIMVEGVEVK
jgi:hypothetical protein